jgi:hypothetical protein
MDWFFFFFNLDEEPLDLTLKIIEMRLISQRFRKFRETVGKQENEWSIQQYQGQEGNSGFPGFRIPKNTIGILGVRRVPGVPLKSRESQNSDCNPQSTYCRNMPISETTNAFPLYSMLVGILTDAECISSLKKKAKCVRMPPTTP